MTRLLLRALPLLAFLLVCWPRGEAHARKGLMLITSGDTIEHVADLDPEVAKSIEEELGPGVAVGYKYEQFGLFFIEIWAWDGEYVFFRGGEYWERPESEIVAAAGVSMVDELPKPFLYTFPPGLMVLSLLAVVFIAYRLMVAGGGHDDEREVDDEDNEDDLKTQRYRSRDSSVSSLMPLKSEYEPPGKTHPAYGSPVSGGSPGKTQPAYGPPPVPGESPRKTQPAYGPPPVPGSPPGKTQPSYGPPPVPGEPPRKTQPSHGPPPVPGGPGRASSGYGQSSGKGR